MAVLALVIGTMHPGDQFSAHHRKCRWVKTGKCSCVPFFTYRMGVC